MSSTARPLSVSGDRPTPAAALTAVPETPQALRELERVLDVFRTVNRKAKDVVSDSRLQQLEWVAGELSLALPLGLTETAGDSLAELLAPDAVHAYLLYGRGGYLRSAPIVATDPTSYDTSERIRIFCLERIADQARIPFEAPDLPPWGLRPTVSPRMADLITAHLDDEARQWHEADRPDVIVRGLAMWGVMRDVLPRLGELESMLLEDLVVEGDTPRALTLVRQPQGGLRGKMPEPETLALSADTGHHLEHWLERRPALIHRLEGTAPRHLWLGTRVPNIGIPIDRRGISKWYKKVADDVQIKQDAANVPEEDLVPTRWETMRRTLLAQRQATEGTA
ncbi:tyrosine integrase [Streptomyces phage Gilgamesh]|uniref:Tyrosine integrase n=1 Tax=Streptomyces phage Gilgamesh TaxID=2599890 RepID=A0A5J6TT10_9CAUD|nr:tyrosine integrase [Streptomyces phage Gilgamesh]QFG13194.1 tyrosine integrase [Streptomyces phage Gilgamesh]